MILTYPLPNKPLDLTTLTALIVDEVQHPITASVVGMYLYVELEPTDDESVVVGIIDAYFADPDTTPEDITQVEIVSTGLDIRSIDSARDSIRITDGGSSITIDGTVELSAGSLSALENVNATIQSNATVNVTQLNNNTIALGNGPTTAGTIRVAIVDDIPSLAVGASQTGEWSVGISKVNGSPIAVGAGASNSATQRVILSSDTPTLTTNAVQSGSWSVSVSPSSNTGISNATSGAYADSIVAKAASGVLYSVGGFNSGPAKFIHVYDSPSIPTNGTAPVYIFYVGATSNFNFNFGQFGRRFNSGISLGTSSTGPTKTLGPSDCWFDVQYQ